MLPLDHIPFYGNSLDALRDAFDGLGFRVSPRGAYRSPQPPERVWPNHSVFLAQNWFDLLLDPRPGAATRIAPGGCLFRTDDLAGLRREHALALADPYELVRAWDEPLGLPAERFELASLAQPVCPLRAALIQHPYPCRDTRPDWYQHSNSARAISGLVFCAERPELAPALRSLLDLSGLEYAPRAEFAARFGAEVSLAVRILVTSRESAARALHERGTAFEEREGALLVPAQRKLSCGFEFVEPLG